MIFLSVFLRFDRENPGIRPVFMKDDRLKMQKMQFRLANPRPICYTEPNQEGKAIHMITLRSGPVRIRNGRPEAADSDAGREKTLAYSILSAHDPAPGPGGFHIRFDSLISHDITYVGVIQTAMASGLERFPVPYVLTNCHNSLCAVGGTINADDHAFGLSAAKKFGGIFVPPNMAVIHQYAREELAGCGRMVLGSDSHTRYGALGCMGVGEGGGELVRQLLGNTWDLTPAPKVVLVWLSGAPRPGVGPHDVAIALCGAVYKNGFVKNAVLEFAGPGAAKLSMDYRIGIDVMTTETACLSSIWETDGAVEEYYAIHGRPEDYKKLTVAEGALYDRMIEIDLDTVEPMAALPFHPSEAVTVRELAKNAGDILREVERRAEAQYGGKTRLHLCDRLVDGRLRVEQGVIAGCSGGMYDNLAEAAAILAAAGGAGECSLSVYPPSIPVQLEMVRSGLFDRLTACGAILKPCFCGPCFGAGDVPANDTLSIRHTTRNFPNREGSRPGDGQLSAVMLMDARSIAATVGSNGFLTPADEVEFTAPAPVRRAYDRAPYERRVYFGFGKADPAQELRFGPNIVAWPEIPALAEDLLLRLAAVIHDEVTTTDELIPSGETSSYRSNPIKLASFTLSRREPAYVGRANDTAAMETARRSGRISAELRAAAAALGLDEAALGRLAVASAIFAEKPGDGSAREQAASCQRVLGGAANICREYATKRYRSNCINWGMLPFTIDADVPFDCVPGDFLYIPGIRAAVERGDESVEARALHDGRVETLTLRLRDFTAQERAVVLAGCLMNWYKNQR